jgi:hypothetical protein
MADISSRFPRARIARIVFLAAAVAVYFTLAPRWPKDNQIHIILGVAASQVEELRLGYALAPKNGPIGEGAMAEDWTRGATFRFAGGSAPRIVTHDARLADGDYVVEIEILKVSHEHSDAGTAAVPPHDIVRVIRRVTLEGGTTSIDLTEAVAGLAVPQ